jgi:serine/threonine-protein kinase
VKVLDFGVAKLLDSEAGDQTTAGSLVGTLRYMAPEQIAGDPPDARVDVYAAGIVLYEMLAGALPYEARDRFQLLRAVVNDPPVPLAVRAPELPAGLADVVMHAIAKDPATRFASADEFRAALAPYAPRGAGLVTGDIAAPPPGMFAPVPVPAPAPEPEMPTVAGRPEAIAASSALKNEFTTAAGLSAATRPLPPTGGRVGALVAGGVVVGVLSLLGAIGILWMRTHERSAAAPAVSPTAATPAPPAEGAVVLVRTDPAGASVRDSASGEILCTATPCAVGVMAGHPRRVTLTHGTLGMQALLEPGVSPFFVELHAGDAPAPPAAVAAPAAPPAVAAPPAPTPTPRPARRARPAGNDDELPMFRPRGGGAMPMFGPRAR